MFPLWGFHWHGLCPHCHKPSCIYRHQWWDYRCGSCDTVIKFEEMIGMFYDIYGPCPKNVTSPYIANLKSKEVHIRGCVWASRIADHNRLECFPYGASFLIKLGGFNGCYYCLPEYDMDKHVVTQESMDKIFTYLASIPVGIDLAKFQLPLKNGLTWYYQKNGMYFDINKPTIIWIHGWGDVKTPDYPNFLYADRFLKKGYNVATYNWDKELTDNYINPYPACIGANPCFWWFNPCWWREDAYDAKRISDLNRVIGTYVVTCNSCRKAVLTQVWRPGGSGEAFRNILEGFFGQEKLQSYTEEVTLLGHSTGAQLITLGLRSFVEENNPLEQLKLRVVFADPWFPNPAHLTLYPLASNQNPHYNTGLAMDILARVSDKGNPVIFLISTLFAGGEADDTLSGIKSKATGVGIWPDGFGEFLKTMHNYTSMREAAYPWGKDVAHPDGVRHWYAIDWYCELIDSPPPESYEKVIEHDPEEEDIYKGRNVPSPNLGRTNIQKNRHYSRKSGSTTYSPGDDTFYESKWVP